MLLLEPLEFHEQQSVSRNLMDLTSNSTVFKQIVLLTKKSNQFDEVVVGNLKIKDFNDLKLCCREIVARIQNVTNLN